MTANDRMRELHLQPASPAMSAAETGDRREIEAKYLVRGERWRGLGSSREIEQGFLSRDAERVVRVRVIDGEGYLTVKGSAQGLERIEFEYDVPVEDARALLQLCLPRRVRKIRHEIRHGGVLWEVDEFEGANKGLVLAELEFPPGEEAAATHERKRTIEAELPEWIGKEVSGEARYYNAVLSRRPFSEWSDAERSDMEAHARGSAPEG